MSGEIGHHLGRKLYGPLFTRHVRSLGLAHQPITIGVDPAIEPVAFDGPDDPHRDISRQEALRHDRKVGVHKDAAIECSHGFCQPEGLDQHLHAERWPSAGDGESNTSLP